MTDTTFVKQMKKEQQRIFRALERTVKGFEGRLVQYNNGLKLFHADAFTKKGWVWKCSKSHVFSVNDWPLVHGQSYMTERLQEGIERCGKDQCGYCAE